MSQIKSEQYTPSLKAYLTYDRTPEIGQALLTEKKRNRVVIVIDGHEFKEKNIIKSFSDSIIKTGGQVTKSYEYTHEGRKNVFGIPVTIRIFSTPKKSEQIRVRVTAENALDLFKNIEVIRNGLSKWGVVPTLCVWEKFTDITPQDTKENSTQKEIIDKDYKRLFSVIESLQQEVAELKERPIKRAMIEERAAMRDVIG